MSWIPYKSIFYKSKQTLVDTIDMLNSWTVYSLQIFLTRHCEFLKTPLNVHNSLICHSYYTIANSYHWHYYILYIYVYACIHVYRYWHMYLFCNICIHVLIRNINLNFFDWLLDKEYFYTSLFQGTCTHFRSDKPGKWLSLYQRKLGE